jgi:hypothetical protein
VRTRKPGPMTQIKRLKACLEAIERRLREGYAPGQPWSNAYIALHIVCEEKAKAGIE